MFLLRVDYDTFLAFSKVTGIETVHLTSEPSPDDVPNPNAPRPVVENATYLRNVIGLAFDFKTQRYFFSDIQRGDIQSVHFNGTGFRVVVDSEYKLSDWLIDCLSDWSIDSIVSLIGRLIV
jgi:integrin beta 2